MPIHLRRPLACERARSSLPFPTTSARTAAPPVRSHSARKRQLVGHPHQGKQPHPDPWSGHFPEMAPDAGKRDRDELTAEVGSMLMKGLGVMRCRRSGRGQARERAQALDGVEERPVDRGQRLPAAGWSSWACRKFGAILLTKRAWALHAGVIWEGMGWLCSPQGCPAPHFQADVDGQGAQYAQGGQQEIPIQESAEIAPVGHGSTEE